MSVYGIIERQFLASSDKSFSSLMHLVEPPLERISVGNGTSDYLFRY